MHVCIHTYISNNYSITCEAMSSRCADLSDLTFLPSFCMSQVGRPNPVASRMNAYYLDHDTMDKGNPNTRVTTNT